MDVAMERVGKPAQCFQGSAALGIRRDGGGRTRNAAGYEPEPGTARIAAMPSRYNSDPMTPR